MIYPLLPVFLSSVLGAAAGDRGDRGAAESVAALLKLASGWWSDRLPRRKPLVVRPWARIYRPAADRPAQSVPQKRRFACRPGGEGIRGRRGR